MNKIIEIKKLREFCLYICPEKLGSKCYDEQTCFYPEFQAYKKEEILSMFNELLGEIDFEIDVTKKEIVSGSDRLDIENCQGYLQALEGCKNTILCKFGCEKPMKEIKEGKE